MSAVARGITGGSRDQSEITERPHTVAEHCPLATLSCMPLAGSPSRSDGVILSPLREYVSSTRGKTSPGSREGRSRPKGGGKLAPPETRVELEMDNFDSTVSILAVAACLCVPHSPTRQTRMDGIRIEQPGVQEGVRIEQPSVPTMGLAPDLEACATLMTHMPSVASECGSCLQVLVEQPVSYDSDDGETRSEPRL